MLGPRGGPFFISLLDIARGWTQHGGMLSPGDKAPDFRVLDDRGNTVTLADFSGKTLVLWFYPRADTPG